jgi:hypothetical protein
MQLSDAEAVAQIKLLNFATNELFIDNFKNRCIFIVF